MYGYMNSTPDCIATIVFSKSFVNSVCRLTFCQLGQARKLLSVPWIIIGLLYDFILLFCVNFSGELLMNTSIDGADDECDVARADPEDDAIKESNNVTKEQSVAEIASHHHSITADKDSFLRQIEMFSKNFTSAEISQYRSSEILRLHSHLMTLLNATASALRPKCISPDSQS